MSLVNKRIEQGHETGCTLIKSVTLGAAAAGPAPVLAKQTLQGVHPRAHFLLRRQVEIVFHALLRNGTDQSPAGDGLRDPSVIGAKNGNTVDFGLQGYAGNGLMPQRGHYEYFGQSINGADLIGMFGNINVGKRGNEVIR